MQTYTFISAAYKLSSAEWILMVRGLLVNFSSKVLVHKILFYFA